MRVVRVHVVRVDDEHLKLAKLVPPDANMLVRF